QRGQANHQWLAQQTFLRRAATLPRYRLYDAGAHPVLVEDPTHGRAIQGELWQIEETLLPELGEFEGVPGLFERVGIAVEGEQELVWAYLYRGDVTDLPDAGSAWP